MNQNIAVLDLGTNTFHLLIAKAGSNGLEILFKDKKFVRLGKGSLQSGKLDSAAMVRGLKVLKKYRKIIEKLGAEEVKAYATASLRDVANSSEFVSKAYKEAGLNIEIISGDEEAQLIYEGVKSSITITKPSLIMDIGGGSVEFVLCDEKKIFWKKSFKVGAQVLLDKFYTSDPIGRKQQNLLSSFLIKELDPLLSNNSLKPKMLIGASGSFSTLQKMAWENFQTRLSPANFEMLLQEFTTKNKQERLAIRGMLPQRVDMIVVASCIINLVLQHFSIDDISVSKGALKEGALNRMLRKK